MRWNGVRRIYLLESSLHDRALDEAMAPEVGDEAFVCSRGAAPAHFYCGLWLRLFCVRFAGVVGRGCEYAGGRKAK